MSNQFLRSILNQACHFYIPILQILPYFSPKWFDAKIRHHYTDVVYLNLKKAFDLDPHNKHLFKLWRIEVRAQLWFWFQGYLSDRYHFVQYNGAASACLLVVSGVLQGSVLGPLLLFIDIDDIATAISYSTIYLIADDVKVAKSIALENDCMRQFYMWLEHRLESNFECSEVCLNTR